jgi:hypothetical protein
MRNGGFGLTPRAFVLFILYMSTIANLDFLPVKNLGKAWLLPGRKPGI